MQQWFWQQQQQQQEQQPKHLHSAPTKHGSRSRSKHMITNPHDSGNNCDHTILFWRQQNIHIWTTQHHHPTACCMFPPKNAYVSASAKFHILSHRRFHVFQISAGPSQRKKMLFTYNAWQLPHPHHHHHHPPTHPPTNQPTKPPTHQTTKPPNTNPLLMFCTEPYQVICMSTEHNLKPVQGSREI